MVARNRNERMQTLNDPGLGSDPITLGRAVVSGRSGAGDRVPVWLGRPFLVRLDSHGPAVAPDHRVLSEAPLSVECFGDCASQGFERLPVPERYAAHGFAAFTS
jgi:hypothetical protein